MAVLKHLPTGLKWENTDGSTYEVTAVYCLTGKYYYHIKVNGEYIYEGGVRSKKLIPEDDVREFRRNKK